MNRELIASCYVYFVKEATVVDGVTVSRTVKPDANPTSNWPQLGTVPKEGLSIVADEQVVRVDRPEAGGSWVKYDSIPAGTSWMIRGTLQDFDNIAVGLIFGSATQPPVNATPFNALRNKASARGWLKLQLLDHTGTVVATMDAFGRLVIKDTKIPGAALTTPGFEFEVLYSSENAGLLAW